jgi:hypothetical protein
VASDFTATIDWGDGTNSSGAVVSTGGGGFSVTGAHAYADEGQDTISVAIADDGGSMASAISTAVVADADVLAAQAVDVSAIEGASRPMTVATFTDTDPHAVASDFTATIDWGDGHTTSGTVIASGGVFAVTGKNPYAEEGPYTINVTISDVGGFTTTVSSPVNVADAALTATSVNVRAVEGASTPMTVATFTDADPNAVASDFTATTINWGDGHTTLGTVMPSGGVFAVTGTNPYAEEGPYTINVTISDGGGFTTTVSSPVNVADAALTATNVNVSATEGASTPMTVATFTDADPNAVASDFTATINWGDGHTTSGTVIASGGVFAVTGANPYAEEGPYNINVTISDGGGFTTSVTSPVTVADIYSIAAPQSIVVQQGLLSPVGAIRLSDPDATSTNETITATLADTNGILSANASARDGGGKITGSGTSLTITGTLDQVNADLTTLTDQDSSLNPDSITIAATDSLGGAALQQTIAVSVNSLDHWANASGGDWAIASNWSRGVPSAGIGAAIDLTGSYTVTISSADTAYGLILNDAGATVLDKSSGSLTLTGAGGAQSPNGALSINYGTFVLAGGSLRAGSISIGSGGAFLVTQGQYTSQNSIGAVADNGSFTVANSVSANIAGGITGTGSFTIENSANLIISGPDSVTGSFTIANTANLEFVAPETASIIFAPGSNSTLKLDSLSPTGQISGLNTNDKIDLAGLAFVQGGMKASFSGNTSGGILTVSNGTQRVAIGLLGNYTQSSWHISPDKTGGSIVVDPPLTGSLTWDPNGGAQGSIDLSNISFGTNTTLGYSANSDNTGGTLTVSDGLHATSLALLGQFIASSFVMSSDSHGGTLITDPSLTSHQNTFLTLPQHA